MPSTEKSIVTTDAMENFVSSLRNKVFDWHNPSGSGKKDWEEAYAANNAAYNITNGETFKLIPATKSEIDNLFEGWSLS